MRITKEDTSEETTEYTYNMSTGLALVTVQNKQAGLPKSIVPDLGWFDRNRTKFEDWWREIQLFLKNNRVNRTDNRITAILAHLKGSVAEIYAQKKLDKLDEETDTQDWDEFVRKLKTMFSNKSKATNTEWKIKTFKQGKKHIANFMIEFEALVMKADIDKLHTILLLKKNV